MFRRSLVILFMLILALSLVSGAAAQSYLFRVDKEVVDVFLNADGTMAIDYVFNFTNEPGGHVIDFVDIGTPNSSFDQVSADVNGSAVSISSDYQGSGSGFAVDMGSHAIQPGQSGTLHVRIGRVSQVLFPDENDQAYASAEFAPSYFGSQYVRGSTDLTVSFHMPPGVKSEEPRWHNAPSGFPSEPQTSMDSEGRPTYTWNNPNANAHTSYVFGASFPRSYVPADAIYTAPPPPVAAPPVNIDSGTIFNFICFGFVAFMFLVVPTITALQGQRRKLQYLPPRVAIEGHGIKRGLTAVEAAILMEQPLDKVLTMILFGVVKKNAAQVTTRNPVEIKRLEPLPEGLHDYEKQFLDAFAQPAGAPRQKALQDLMVAIVRQVAEKMRGFSRRETIDYYKAIMERAWQQVEAADTPEVKGQKLDEGMEWTMLDRDYDGRMQRTFRGPIFVPTWWGNYDPTFGRPSVGGAGKTAAPSMPSMPSVPSSSPRALPGADFAASVVGGVQGFSSRVIGDLNTFTSKVTGMTNPPPKPTVGSATRGGGGTGGGCVCACACACAGCACACAGGGR